MNIILIGFMGTGKTAVGKRLAQKLHWQFLDADTLIEQSAGMPIPDIFAQKGEDCFRDIESSMIKTLQTSDNFVISTGGGIILRTENVVELKKLGPLVLLLADPEVIYQRVREHTHRPLLSQGDPKQKIDELLAKRIPLYEQAADYKIDTTKLSIDQVVKEIVNYVKDKS